MLRYQILSFLLFTLYHPLAAQELSEEEYVQSIRRYTLDIRILAPSSTNLFFRDQGTLAIVIPTYEDTRTASQKLAEYPADSAIRV